MTKSKTFKFGKLTFKPYFKPVGHGFEVGVTYAGKPFFVGNFIHAHEANQWWKLMCTQITGFINRHEFVPTASPTWYCKYLGNILYKDYYTWLDKCFTKYNTTYSKATTQDFKKYKTFEKSYFNKPA